MIQLKHPFITQEQFADAFAVLEECKNPPGLSFIHPYMGPGGQYGNCWWERDTALALSGYCWLDQAFSMNALINFTYAQKENGRIPLWGHDTVGDYDRELSAIPVIFDVCRRICRRTTDRAYIERIYQMLAAYLDWWLSPIKRDAKTGLICAIFEESDPSDYHDQLTYAPVDTNVQVCVGADILCELAEYLGYEQDALRYRALFYELRNVINTQLWDEESGAYYTKNVKTGELMTYRPYNSTFDTFKRGIAPKEHHEKMLAVLKNNDKYGYDQPYGITTAPKDSPEYCETVGIYKGWTSWSGNVWTLRNEIIARGLHESGLHEEAAHIAHQTVMTFNGNYAEFASPSTGEGHGVLRYAWTASQYVELLIEEIFGIDWCAWNDTLTVTPNIPAELYGHTIALQNLPLGNGKYAHVSVKCEKNPAVSYEITDKER